MNEDQFWCSALGRWIRLCISSPNPVILEAKWRHPQAIGHPLRYDEICDGYLLNALLELIYPECTFYELIKYKDRSHSKSYRLSLLQSFLFNLVQFFKRHEKIPLTLPDVINVSQNSSPERSGHDLQQLIGLLIGAAVHTTHKSLAVDQLRRLINQEEKSLGLHLQKIFDGRDPIIDLSLHPEVFGTIAEERHINTFKLLTKMLDDTESDETSSNSGEMLKLNDRIPSPDEQKYHEVIEDLRLKNKHLTEKSNFLENQCHEQEDEIMRFKKDLDHLNKEKEKIQKDHDKLKETCRFVPALENKVQKLESMEVDYEKLKAEIHKLKQNKSLCNDQAQQIIGLRKEVRELRGQNNALLNQKYDFTEKANIEKEKGKLAEDLQRTKEQKDEMEKENEDLKLQIEGLEDKIEQMKCRMNDTFVTAPNISLCDELNESQREDQFKELQMENNSLFEIIKKNSEEISRYETASKELREKIQEMEEQLNEKANDMHVKEKTVLVELNNYKNKIKSLDQKISDQLKVIEQKDSLINRMKQTEVQLQSELKKVEEIQKNKKQLEIVVQNKCNEIDHTRAEIEDLRDELERLKKLHSQCDRSKKALQEELNLVGSQLETTDEDNRNLRLSIANTKIIQNRLQKIENELVKRDTANTELKANLRTLTEKYQLENKMLQQLRADLTKENGRLSSLVSKLRAVCMNCSIREDNINDDELIERIDNVLIKAYTNAWKEAEALSQQRRVQLEEIKVFSKDIENLKKKGADLENPEKERDIVTVTKELNSMTERWRMAQSRETDLIEQIKSVKSDKEDLLRKNIDLKKDLSAATHKFNTAEDENRRLTDQLKAAENQLSKLHLDLKEVKSNREALQAEFDRLNELYNSVTADFERSNYERNDLKRRLGKKDQLLEDKMKTEFFNERCLLEDRLKQTNRELNLEKERLKLYENDLNKLTEELTENKKDYATLVRQKNKSDEMLNGLRIADVDQKNKIASLNESVNQLNEVITDKNTEISAIKKQLEYLKNLRQWNSEENDLLMKKVKSLMEQNQEMHYHSEVYVLSQQSLDERLNAVVRYKRAAEEKMKECNNNSEFNKDKRNFMNKAAKALRLKSTRRPTKPIDKNSGSNTEDSSIYSADESSLPPLPEPRLEKSNRESVQVTPTCSSSERASGSSPDYDQVQYFSVPSKKIETSYQQIRSPPPLPPSSFSRLRNSKISSSVRYPPAHKIQSPLGSIPVTKDDESLSLSTMNGYSTPINGSPIKSNGRPPPPYRGRPVGTPTVNRNYFNPLDTSTPKSAERSFSRVVGEGEDRLTVRSPEERESKAQSFYDNHDISQEVNKKTNDLWVGYGCV